MRPWERYDSELTCYQEFGKRIFPTNTNCDRCNIVTNTKAAPSYSTISIFPNPITNISTVVWPVTINARQLIVYDLSGSIIFMKEVIRSGNVSISSQELGKGVLLFELIDNDQNSYKKSILVL